MNAFDPRASSSSRRLSLRQRLRAETRERHDTLDRSFGDLLADADLAAYRRFLQVSHACHAAVEVALARTEIATRMPGWTERSRLAALEADLTAMSIPALDVPSFDLDAADFPSAVGAAYVLEGSRVGGRFILKQFLERNAADVWPDASFRFLGAGADHRFQDFLTFLEALTFNDADTLRCVSGANQTFDVFASALASGAKPGTSPS